jgi:hypothetical protein
VAGAQRWSWMWGVSASTTNDAMGMVVRLQHCRNDEGLLEGGLSEERQWCEM